MCRSIGNSPEIAEENFRAITELALSSKAAGEGIGNKGLGFRRCCN